MNLVTAIPRLAASAATIALVPPEALMQPAAHRLVMVRSAP